MWKVKVLSAALLAVLLCGCASSETEQTAAEVQPSVHVSYRLAAAVQGDFQEKVSAKGRMYYPDQEIIRCEYEDAVLAQDISVSGGKEVKKGDVLAVIQQKTSDARLARLELEAENAENTKDRTVAGYAAELKEIKGEDAGAVLRRTGVQNALNIYLLSAEKQCLQAQKRLEEYRGRYEPKNLTAPCDGVVKSVKNCRPGDDIAYGDEMFTIFNDQNAYVQISNPGGKFADMAVPGMPVTIKNGKKTWTGTIVSVADGQSEAQGQTVYVGGEALRRIQRTAELTVEFTALELNDVVKVPRSAVVFEKSATYVMVYEEGKLHRRYVVCGPGDTREICIMDGLESGQQVALN